MKEQLNGGAREADKDQLISEDSDGIYRRCPGVNNVAYVVGDGRLLANVPILPETPTIQIRIFLPVGSRPRPVLASPEPLPHR